MADPDLYKAALEYHVLYLHQFYFYYASMIFLLLFLTRFTLIYILNLTALHCKLTLTNLMNGLIHGLH